MFCIYFMENRGNGWWKVSILKFSRVLWIGKVSDPSRMRMKEVEESDAHRCGGQWMGMKNSNPPAGKVRKLKTCEAGHFWTKTGKGQVVGLCSSRYWKRFCQDENVCFSTADGCSRISVVERVEIFVIASRQKLKMSLVLFSQTNLIQKLTRNTRDRQNKEWSLWRLWSGFLPFQFRSKKKWIKNL